MSEPQKRTREELERENVELLKKIEKDNPTPSSPVPPTASASEEVPTPSPSKDVPSSSPSASEEVPTASPSASEEVPPSPSPDVPPEKSPKKEEPKKEEKPMEDWKKRHDESTREAQRLYRNNSQMMTAIAEASNLPDPTEEELKTEYKNWDDLSETERTFAKDSFINKRFRASVAKAAAEQKGVQEWRDRVDSFIEDPRTLTDNPDLEGKEDEFLEFVLADNKLVGTDFSILVGAFLHAESKKPKKTNKGDMFPTGKSGPAEKPHRKSDKISQSDAEVLKISNYKKYLEFLKAGKIEQSEV
jgi:hypothetical protein